MILGLQELCIKLMLITRAVKLYWICNNEAKARELVKWINSYPNQLQTLVVVSEELQPWVFVI